MKMKKMILLAAALLMMVPVANAQLKSSADVKKYVENAKANTLNPKKAEKASTWMKLGESYFKAFTDATGGVQVGQDEMNANLFIQAKPLSQEQVTVEGKPTVKVIFQTVNLYYQDGIVVAVEPTDLAYPDCLTLASEAFAKAYALDPKKGKDITEQLNQLIGRLNMMGGCWYTLGDNERSSLAFEQVYDMSLLTDLTAPEEDAMYNAILVSYFSQDAARVRELCEKAIGNGYDAKGENYAKLGDAFGMLGEKDKQKEILEKGFSLYPENESLLLSLINFATENGEPSDYIFSLLHKAQELDPNNASLWYVEGNIYLNEKNFDTALSLYRKAQEMDPNYLFSFYQEGVLWASKFDALQEEATLLPPNTPISVFDEYDAKLQDCLVNAVNMFEQCFEMGPDDFKLACSQSLSQLCFMLRNVAETYSEKSTFYKEYYEQHQK